MKAKLRSVVDRAVRSGVTSIAGAPLAIFLHCPRSLAEPTRSLDAGTAPATDASAETPGAADSLPGTGLWGQRFGGRRWEVQVGVDYSRATTDANGLELDPYAVGLGLAAGYFTPGGLGFGLSADIYKGRTISQVYQIPLTDIETPVDAKSHLADVGIFLAYDQPLGPVLLRYQLTTDVGFLSWDFGSTPFRDIAGFSPQQGSMVVVSLDPGVGIIWPIGAFFAGARLHYRVPFTGQLPAALGCGVSLGVRL